MTERSEGVIQLDARSSELGDGGAVRQGYQGVRA